MASLTSINGVRYITQGLKIKKIIVKKSVDGKNTEWYNVKRDL